MVQRSAWFRNDAFAYVVALAIRLAMFSIPSIATTLADRVELTTPVTSYKRLAEGVFLYESNVPPYDADLFHQMPLLLGLFSILRTLPSFVIPALYSMVDMIIAHCLGKIAIMKQGRYAEQPKLKVEEKLSGLQPSTVVYLYLFNPLTILSCVSKSTILFTNLSIVMAIFWAMMYRPKMAMFWAALASYLSFYPLMLLPPLIIMLRHPSTSMWITVSTYIGWLLALLGLSWCLVGSWDFINATYGVIIFLRDLTPNVGMFWYFFIEMFEQFRSFFMITFQFHAFIFVAPLCIKLSRHNPLFVLTVLCGVMGIFKSYPSAGDASMYLALIPLHDELLKYCRYGFLITNLFLYSSVLSPIFWHLWIYAGSGNANFFYAITLVYNLGQVLFIIDLVYAALRRDFDVAHPETIGKQIIHK
ncbi:GPI transamidase subunit PIG-U [Radiomyces spectabilis]|uniref:GPI transamidase subunit PIG-U n=1 Tax=Radiomyces spectabilis TaxID=64574 RepID=UPI002220130D|nr:GPI transamidase subunit PIG-U [Radiomyces spectabilis]KAI8364651.1 GPI transamidase subunit PIG-U [Radiomyces spectabilis]